MIKILVFVTMALVLFSVACGGGSKSQAEAMAAVEGVVAEGPIGTPAPAVAPARPPTDIAAAMVRSKAFGLEAPEAMAGDENRSPSVAGSLDIAQRKVISMASVSIEVEVVEAAVTNVQVIAEGLGGFVEHLSSSGRPERQIANVTVRVPQVQFFTALERIKALGEVRDQQVGSEDVSERFIDLEARLKSSLREEQSLLSLLERTQTVGEILTIERELSRVRSEIERLQGQLNFLERRVELATINVSLFSPAEHLGEPPFAGLMVEVGDVGDSVALVKKLLLSLNGSLDNVFLSVNDDQERAEISLRVFPSDFDRTVATLEREGKVRSKEVRESTRPTDGEKPPSKDPDARINVSFVSERGSSNTWLIVSISAPIGGVALVVVLGFVLYLTYRAGRSRGRGV